MNFIYIGRPSERLTKKAINLLAQLCVQYPNEATVFELSAKLLKHEPLQRAQKLQKAYRAQTQVSEQLQSLFLYLRCKILFSWDL